MRSALAKCRVIYRACLCGGVLFFLAVSASLAQRYSFREVTAGLGNPNVNCIAQDRSGYLWVGTENGLYRYDGSQFKRFGVAEGLRSRSIQSLFFGIDGTFWVGTTAGIYHERQDGSFAEVPPPAPINQFSLRRGTVFTAFAPDRVVVADQSGVFLLRRIEAEQWVAEPMKLEGAAIWSVLVGPDGSLWYGCDSDLCRLSDGKTTHMRPILNRASNRSEKLPEDQWIRLLLDHDGHLWLRGYRHVVEVIAKENQFELRDLPAPATTLPYLGLAEDAQGQIVASQGPAFGLWGHGRWRMVTSENGLSHSDISELFVDREGSLWFGVVGHGMSRWVGQGQWEAYTVAEGLSDDIVWATLRDKGGRLWICTESGLNFVPTGEKMPRAWKAEGVSTVRAISLAESADGAIWVGTAAGVLVQIDPKTLAGREWKTPEIYRILADGSHRLWLATSGGLFVVDTAMPPSRLLPTLVKDPEIGHPTGRFSDLALDSAEQLWAASTAATFECLQSDTIQYACKFSPENQRGHACSCIVASPPG